MCDTCVALSTTTLTGSVLLAKNADTEVNEAQHLLKIPGRAWPEGAQLRLSHRVIPQARRTHEVVLDKSFRLYGGAFVADCWREADVLERRWLAKLSKIPGRIDHAAYGSMLQQFNAATAMELT